MPRSLLLRALAAQARMELVLTLRRGESVLVTLVIPVVLLLFFVSARVLPPRTRAVDFLLPGTLTLAVISTGLVSLGIATAYERYFGVLKRFGATPFPRIGLIAAKLLTVAALEGIQVIILTGIGVVFLGWRPHGSIALALLVVALGTIAFSGMGLLLAGSARAEATLAGANGLFLLFLLLGGLFVPLDRLPGWLVPVARLTPAAALAETLRSVLRAGAVVPIESTVVLITWAVTMPLLAAATFKWE